jgi:hypothetical protein
MERRCHYCTNLSVNHLIDLGYIEPASPACDNHLSKQAYYRHHRSIHNLHASAVGGTFCQFLVSCLQGYEEDNSWIAEKWVGAGCEPEFSLDVAAKELPCSDIKICISPEDKVFSGTFADAHVIDTLLVQVGPFEDPNRDPDSTPTYEEGPFLPVLALKLTSARGMSKHYFRIHYVFQQRKARVGFRGAIPSSVLSSLLTLG